MIIEVLFLAGGRENTVCTRSRHSLVSVHHKMVAGAQMYKWELSRHTKTHVGLSGDCIDKARAMSFFLCHTKRSRINNAGHRKHSSCSGGALLYWSILAMMKTIGTNARRPCINLKLVIKESLAMPAKAACNPAPPLFFSFYAVEQNIVTTIRQVAAQISVRL